MLEGMRPGGRGNSPHACCALVRCIWPGKWKGPRSFVRVLFARAAVIASAWVKIMPASADDVDQAVNASPGASVGWLRRLIFRYYSFFFSIGVRYPINGCSRFLLDQCTQEGERIEFVGDAERHLDRPLKLRMTRRPQPPSHPPIRYLLTTYHPTPP